MKTPINSDDGLARLLDAAGSALSPADVEALIDGVVAAPEGFDADAWMRLVAPEPGAALCERLRALESEARAGRDDGLARGPAPPARLAALRAELARCGLSGFIVPRADAHHSEFLPRRAERLMWLTGFSGSAGVAVVLAEAAAVFVDGRYTLQAEAQLDGELFERRHITGDPPHEWVAARLGRSGKLGYASWLHTPQGLEPYRAACAKAGGELAACSDNPIDAAWHSQPPAPLAPVVAHEERFAGTSADEKRTQRPPRCAARGLRLASSRRPIRWRGC